MKPHRIAIPDQEYGDRIERLRRHMRGQQLDAVLLGTGMNLQYFSGLPSPQKNVVRPFLLLVPAKADPVLFSHTAFEAETRRFSRITSIRGYQELSCPPIALIRDALTNVGASSGRIGMELGYEQSLDISLLDFRRLETSLPGAELVDASQMLWDLRMVKSEREIDCMRSSCDIVAAAYRRTFKSSKTGMSEAEIYADMLAHLRSSGSDIFLVITSGKGNYHLISKPPEQRLIEAGDMVWMDAGCRVDGYWSDYSRAAIAGKPSASQTHAQQVIRDITLQIIERIRPGMRCSQVAQYAHALLQASSLPATSSLTASAGRVGHGIGLTMTEPPHLGLHDETMLQPGMVVSVEPGIATEYGTFHVEENVVVRDGPCEWLTSSPRGLARLHAPPP